MDLVAKIRDGMDRNSILKMRNNAITRLEKKPEDESALEVLRVIETTAPLRSEYIFMGFMPGADIDRAVDEKWYSEGVCTWEYYKDKNQTELFYKIFPGDVIITKKRMIQHQLMEVYAHGVVIETVNSRHSNRRYLKVDWVHDIEFLQVPLMGCNRTVNVRSLETVEESMPEEFWEWLKQGRE